MHGLSALLADYHLQTETEKGRPVADAAALPAAYRAEVEDPDGAFAGAAVLVARDGDTAAGCVVVTAPVDGRAEIKRLWTAPGFRGRGVASALLDAALAHAARSGVRTVRLSVWRWRTGAVSSTSGSASRSPRRGTSARNWSAWSGRWIRTPVQSRAVRRS